MKCHSSYSYETFSMLCFFPILFLFIFLFTSSAKRGRWMRMLRDQKHTDTIVFVEKNLNILPMESSLKLHDLHSVRRIWSARVRVDWCCATWHFWYYFFVHSSEKSHRAKQSSPVASSHIFFFSLFSVLQAIIEFGCVVSGHDRPFANIFPRIEISSELELNLQNIRHSRFDMRRPQAVTSATSVLFIETNAIYPRMAWVYTVNLSPLGISIRIATANTNIANICLATNKIYINSTRGFGNEILNWSTTFSSQTQCEYRNIRNFFASFA